MKYGIIKKALRTVRKNETKCITLMVCNRILRVDSHGSAITQQEVQ